VCVCVLQVVGHEKDLPEVITKISNCLKRLQIFFVIDYNTCVARAHLLVPPNVGCIPPARGILTMGYGPLQVRGSSFFLFRLMDVYTIEKNNKGFIYIYHYFIVSLILCYNRVNRKH
jgi:hypothetical protein